MRELPKRPQLRTLTLISTPKLAEKASKMLLEHRIPIHYQLRGEGTASSEIMDMLGLGSITKVITVSIMPKPFADEALKRLEDELSLGRQNTGIAFTTAITSINTLMMKVLDEGLRKEIVENMENDTKQMSAGSCYCMIVAIVNQGYSEEVMDAAREAGARGGTILCARQAGGERLSSVLGVSIQEEKDMILILSKADTKLAIMKAVGEKCGMHCEARGIVLSTPIDSIAGLEF